MEIGALFILCALLLLIGMVVARPFFEQGTQHEQTINGTENGVNPSAAMIAQRERIFERMHELESDFALGKIPPPLFTRAREEMLAQGAELMRQLEQIEQSENANRLLLEGEQYGALDRRDERIEQLIQEHRKKNLERMIGFCPKCGKPAQKSDHYCSRCGYNLDRQGN